MSVDFDQLIRRAEIQVRDLGQFIEALTTTASSLRTDIQDFTQARMDFSPPRGAAYSGYGVNPRAAIADSLQRLETAISLLEKSERAWKEHLKRLRETKQQQTGAHAALH